MARASHGAPHLSGGSSMPASEEIALRRWTRALPILTLAATALAVAASPADAGTPPALSFSVTSPVGYGSVAVGQSLDRTFTVMNRGGTATALLKVALVGTAFTIPAGGDLCTAVSLGPKEELRHGDDECSRIGNLDGHDGRIGSRTELRDLNSPDHRGLRF